MKNFPILALATAMAVAITGSVGAQQQAGEPSSAPAVAAETTKAPKAAKVSLYRPLEIQHIRPADLRGINVFESPKDDETPFKGFALSFGGAFTQQFQGLAHENRANPVMVNNVNANQLIAIGHGFNNAVANLNVNAQIAPGIRVAMTSYLSARHHQESWVKDGYILIDASPIDVAALNTLMKYVTARVGHFEINYGDQHFRRSDNGNALYNPFVGNLILDAFTTEIGAEVYARSNGFLAMFGMTGGEVKGQVTAPEKRSPTYLGKIGFDRKLSDDLRVRLTGSLYKKDRSASNTLFTGDRAGARYYDVLENTTSTETAQAWSGNIRPGFSNRVTSYVINPFVRFGGLEYFGAFEQAKGGALSATDPTLRTWKQFSNELVYRFFDADRAYVGARYNTANGTLAGVAPKVGADRTQIAAGWFVTPNILGKVEWVNQKYNNFPTTDIRNGGKFKGFVVEGIVAF
jgi:hypothetical protein